MKTFSLSILMFLCLGLVTTSLHAQKWNKKSITGQGALVKQTLSVDDFQSIGVGLNATVYLTQGSRYKVEIEAQKNIIDALKKEVKDGSWNIGFGDKVNAKNYKKAKIWITMPTVRSLSIGGSGEIIGQTAFNNLDDLKLSIAGSGEIDLKGDAKACKLNIAGSGKINAKNLEMASAKVSIAGSGTTYVHVKGGELNVSIAGSGSVFYNGSAKIKTSIAGSGSVQSL